MNVPVSQPVRALAEDRFNRNLTNLDYALLAACLLLAAAIRLQDIQQPLVDAFSWRQASTAMMADNFRTGSWNIFYPAVSWTGTDTGYQGREFQIISYITAVLHALFGWHDWVGRLVAVGFGLWSVFALHRLTNCIWGNSHAHLVALAYAILPGAALIDRSFLPDPAMLALVTSGVWLLVRYLREERTPLLLASGVLLTLGILAKLPGIAAGVPLAWLAVVWLRLGRVRQAAAVVVVGAVSVTLVAAYYAWAIYLGTTYPPYHLAGHGYIWDEGLHSFVSSKFFVRRAWDHFSLWYLTWPLVMLALVGLLCPPPRSPSPAIGAFSWIFHIWLFAAGLVYLLAALEINNNPWNFHVFSAPLAAFAGRGLFVIISFQTRGAAVPFMAGRLAIVAVFAVVFGTRPALDIMKQSYASSAHLLGQRLYELSEPNDLVIAIAPSEGDPVAIYYSRRRGWVFPPAHHWDDAHAFDAEKALDYLEELRDLGARWFGVTKDARDPHRRLFIEHQAELLAHLDVTAERVVDTPEVLVFQLSD